MFREVRRLMVVINEGPIGPSPLVMQQLSRYFPHAELVSVKMASTHHIQVGRNLFRGEFNGVVFDHSQILEIDAAIVAASTDGLVLVVKNTGDMSPDGSMLKFERFSVSDSGRIATEPFPLEEPK